MSEYSYLDALRRIKHSGGMKEDRTGTGTVSTFATQMRFNLKDGFPLFTTKRVPFRLVASELLWFIRGDTNIRYLLEHGNHIWDEWAFKQYVESDAYTGPDMTDFGRRAATDPDFKKIYCEELEAFCELILHDDDFAAAHGELGNIYGKQWRAWGMGDQTPIDQLREAVELIKTDPDSRRIIVTSWNPHDTKSAALPPCHLMYQFYVRDKKLSCMVTMRSMDAFLGAPFNVASYALETHLVARECGLEVGELVINSCDAHIYINHLKQVDLQLSRVPMAFPTLVIHSNKSMFDIDLEDLEIRDYKSHPAIKGDVAV